MSDLSIRPGYHVVTNNTIEFIIPLEYNFVEYLGGGNYGNVM
jgi:hypothetical protein